MEKENAEEKIRQAVLAIRKSRTNPAGRHWLDVAEGFLAQALALSSPHPEAREEDIEADEARVWQALNVGKGMAEALKLSGDSYSAQDWEDTKDGYGRLLESFRSQLARRDEALREIRTNWGGYMVTKESPWEKTLAAMWKEVQRMDGLARAALREPDGRKGE